MQMKKITLLLMVFALAWSGQLKAVTLPETSKDGKVKWYFIQSMRQDYGEPMFYTVDGDLIRGRVQADYSDYATLAKQLWCFETEDANGTPSPTATTGASSAWEWDLTAKAS